MGQWACPSSGMCTSAGSVLQRNREAEQSRAVTVADDNGRKLLGFTRKSTINSAYQLLHEEEPVLGTLQASPARVGLCIYFRLKSHLNLCSQLGWASGSSEGAMQAWVRLSLSIHTEKWGAWEFPCFSLIKNSNALETACPEREHPWGDRRRPGLWMKRTVVALCEATEAHTACPETIAMTISVGSEVGSISNVANQFFLFLLSCHYWRGSGDQAALFWAPWEQRVWLLTEGRADCGQHTDTSRKAWRWAHCGGNLPTWLIVAIPVVVDIHVISFCIWQLFIFLKIPQQDSLSFS